MRTALLIVLMLAWGGPAMAAERWPTLEFEVFEGYAPPKSERAAAKARTEGLERFDVPAPTATPLSPALKAEMQSYLSSVAAEYQRMGFPPPRLEPIVTRADGKKAYRVYWYAFGDVSHMAGQKLTPARASYACKGESLAVLMHLNARTEGPDGHLIRLARSTGQVPGMLDRLTEKGYGDLAHELFHTVQRGTAFFDANCYPPAWLVEGMAEAVGHDMAWKLRGVLSRPAREQRHRWGFRPYNIGFVPEPANAMEFGYGTSSFWRYLAELERNMQSRSTPAPRPDASLVIRTDAFDYGYLVRLLSDPTRLPGSNQASDSTRLSYSNQTLDWLHGNLKADRRLRLGFDRAFADFQTVFADYGRHRFVSDQTPAERVDRVQKLTLGGCEEYRLDVSAPMSPSLVRLSLKAIGAGCIRLVRADRGTEPLLIDVRALVPKGMATSLYAGVSGEPSATAATVADDGSGREVAAWAVELAPGSVVDLVFVNVHKTPSKTQAVDIEVGFAISGWQWTGPPAPRASAAPAPDRTATRAAKRRTPGSGEESKPVLQGPGAARLEREQAQSPPRGCRWPYPDATLHCQPTMQVVLRRLPRWLAWQEAAAGPDEDDLASEGALLAFTASRSSDALDALDDLQVRIRLPQVDHGFTGTIDNVLITVSGGGWPELVSRGPRNAARGGLAYYAASGQMTIERYDPLEFRGSFRGGVVELPPPGVFKGQTPLDVQATVSGRFTVGRPWEHDDRYEPVLPDPETFFSEIIDQLPGSLRTDPRFAPSEKSSDPTGPGAGRSGSVVASGCDCSCAGMSALIEELERLDDEGTQATTSMIAKAMCLVQCQAAQSQCPEP